MKLVFIDGQYTDFLRRADYRVPFNKNDSYKRPFVGIVFEIDERKYFAPLTSHNKHERLVEKPKAEDVTFFPINDCKHGGINFNNMIPVVEGVYNPVDLFHNKADTPNERKYKYLLNIQTQFIMRNRGKIARKAKTLYYLKIHGDLKQGADKRVCDFKALEIQMAKYKED